MQGTPIQLQAGQNAPLTSAQANLSFNWQQAPAGYEVDLSCFALNASGKVRSDHDFIFFNAPQLAGGGVRLNLSQHSFTLNLDTIPSDIDKLAFTLTLTDGQRRRQTIAELGQIVANLNGDNPMCFELNCQGRQEVAVIVCEIYRRNQQWKLRAVGQGFNGGLKPLAEHYGVDISEGEAQSAPSQSPSKPTNQSTSPAPAHTPTPAQTPTPTPAKKPINLSKITLEKKGQSISLEKSATGFGEIIVNLNWTSQTQKRGFFGGSKTTDLDVGCLYQRRDGAIGGVQALGNSFGNLRQKPYIALDGDDRTGARSGGETLRINGQKWSDMQRILIYAFIYEGAPNWAAANGMVTIKVPGQAEIEVRMDSHSRQDAMCAIAMLENDGAGIKVTKLVDYFKGHQEMDQRYHWGLNWVAGSKD